MTHFLKIWPGSFEAVCRGDKMHEVRTCDDREFKVGDLIVLKEFVPNGTWDVKTRKANGHLTNASVLRRISYVSMAGTWGLPPNICVFSHKPTERDGR